MTNLSTTPCRSLSYEDLQVTDPSARNFNTRSAFSPTGTSRAETEVSPTASTMALTRERNDGLQTQGKQLVPEEDYTRIRDTASRKTGRMNRQCVARRDSRAIGNKTGEASWDEIKQHFKAERGARTESRCLLQSCQMYTSHGRCNGGGDAISACVFFFG